MFNFNCKSFPHLRVCARIVSHSNRLFSHSFSSKSKISLSDSSNQYAFRFSYLINSCGLSPEKAFTVSKYMNFKTPHRPDSVLALFQSHGFTKTQVSNLVTRCPRVLSYDPEKNLLPKLDFLISVGLSRTDLVKIIIASPRILSVPLDTRIVPSFNLFRKLLKTDDKAVTAIKRQPSVLTYNLQTYVEDNIQHLKEVGVPESNIISLLTNQPNACMCATDNFKRIVEDVKEMGFNPLSWNFGLAIQALKQMSKSTWEKKVELYKKWGLSEHDIFVAFGKHPWCMMASEAKITGVMDFLVNKMGLEPSYLVCRPLLICLSLEKRIVPRCLVYQCLLDKGLMKKKKVFGFARWLTSPEITFLNRIRKGYEKEAPELLKVYQAKLDSAK